MKDITFEIWVYIICVGLFLLAIYLIANFMYDYHSMLETSSIAFDSTIKKII